MAKAQTTTPRASAPKPPPPGSAESIRRHTVELESATALLNAAKAVERELGSLPHSAQASAAFGSALMTSVAERERAKPSTISEANVLLTAALAELAELKRTKDAARTRSENVIDAYFDMEEPLRETRYMISVARMLGYNIARCDDGMFAISDNEITRLQFIVGEAERLAIKLDNSFHAPMDAPREGSAKC